MSTAIGSVSLSKSTNAVMALISIPIAIPTPKGPLSGYPRLTFVTMDCKCQNINISGNLVIDGLSQLANALLVLPARRVDNVDEKIVGVGRRMISKI